LCFLFFFSSRRRHTRSLRDWSSDVCSSDLFDPLCPLCSLCSLWFGVQPSAAHLRVHVAIVRRRAIDRAPFSRTPLARQSPRRARSEERRVGKEGRHGGWAWHLTEKT